MKNIKLYLADDHAILREGLRNILGRVQEYTVVGESGDGATALDEIERLNPDIVILDISLPAVSGVDVARKLKKYRPGIKIIILSRHDNEEYIRQLLEYGIDAYVLKDNTSSDLIKAIGDVLEGNIFLSSQITKKIVNNTFINRKISKNESHPSLLPELSNREKEILKLIAEGRSNNEIASLLRISEKTVKVHRLNIMKKLDIHSITDLVKYAIRNGYVEL